MCRTKTAYFLIITPQFVIMFSPTMYRHVLLLGLFLAIYSNANAEANDVTISTPTAEPAFPSCRKMMTSMGKKMFKIFGNCSRELKKIFLKKDEMAEKFQCVVKCALDKSGMMNKEGKVTNATLKSFMDTSVPEFYHEIGFTLTAHCIEEKGTQLDPNDEFCKSYGEFLKCMQETVADYAELCQMS